MKNEYHDQTGEKLTVLKTRTTHQMNKQTKKTNNPIPLVPLHQEIPTRKRNFNELQTQFQPPQIYNPAISLLHISSWHHLHKPRLRFNPLPLFPQAPRQERLRQEDWDPQEEEEDTITQTLSQTLLGPLEEEIQVAAGEILEEGAVTQEEEVEIPIHHTTNYRDNSPRFLTETAESPMICPVHLWPCNLTFLQFSAVPARRRYMPSRPWRTNHLT